MGDDRWIVVGNNRDSKTLPNGKPAGVGSNQGHDIVSEIRPLWRTRERARAISMVGKIQPGRKSGHPDSYGVVDIQVAYCNCVGEWFALVDVRVWRRGRDLGWIVDRDDVDVHGKIVVSPTLVDHTQHKGIGTMEVCCRSITEDDGRGSASIYFGQSVDGD